MTLQILIEGEYPTLVEANADFDAASYIGHRFRFSLRDRLVDAVLIDIQSANAPVKISVTLQDFSQAYAVLNHDAIRFAQVAADFYLTELSAVLALMLPPAPKRISSFIGSNEILPAAQPGALNARQNEIFQDIRNTPINVADEHLLWGVTGSGKTRIYEHLIKDALEAKRQVILLVPEIALSNQLIEIIERSFPSQAVVYHSGLADGERLKNYRRFLAGDARIAVGARSAVFLPAADLGYIIIDEEHDAAYKDQRKIRYDARTLARLRLDSRTKLVLGSATPSLESLARAKTGESRLYRLRQRATGQQLPQVFVPKYQIANGLVSPFLNQKMHEHLSAGNQVMLLLNRRGHSTHVVCAQCEQRTGKAYVECPRCAVALAYHKDGKLRCHYCGYTEAYHKLCPIDKVERRLVGRGIQRVEEILETQFAAYEYARLDRDTARTKDFAPDVLQAMRESKIQILIGTQMIAKGFDLPGVTLVGVLAIDQMLNAPDFRAAESAWQLLAQVIGRSGRHRPGEVVIQTMAPRHPAILAAQEHDADAFYALEANYRRLTKYPPFGALARFVLFDSDENELFEAAEMFQREMQVENRSDLFSHAAPNVEILGPAIPALSKLEGEFRAHFLIKAANTSELQQYLKCLQPLLSRVAGYSQLRTIIDIEPRDLG